MPATGGHLRLETREDRYEALGLLETETIYRGFEAADAMAKAARVAILASDPIPPGRFLILIGGEVGEVDASFRRGMEAAGPLHDHLFLPQAAPGLLEAIRTGQRPGAPDAVGIFETASVAAAVDAADRGLKGAGVRLLSLHLARGIRGGAFGLFEGRQEQVESALAFAEERARAHGRWTGATLLARPDPDLCVRLLAGVWGRLEDTEIL